MVKVCPQGSVFELILFISDQKKRGNMKVTKSFSLRLEKSLYTISDMTKLGEWTAKWQVRFTISRYVVGNPYWKE